MSYVKAGMGGADASFRTVLCGTGMSPVEAINAADASADDDEE